MTDLHEEGMPITSSGSLPDESAHAQGRSEGDEPVALEDRAIRARRRPIAVLFVWLWETVCAFLVATPVHAWAARVWGAHPDGDAALFRPGGHALLSWLGDDGAALAIVSRSTLLALLVFGIAGQLVTGALVASLATGVGPRRRGPPAAFCLRVGGASFFPLLGASALFGLVQASVLGLGLFVSSALDHALATGLGEARAFTVRLVVLACFAVAACAIGVVADFARVSIARAAALAIDERPSLGLALRRALGASFAAARGHLGSACLSWGIRTVASLALLVASARAGDLVGGRGGGALWVLFAVHQGVIFARAALRASWLANALRLVPLVSR